MPFHRCHSSIGSSRIRLSPYRSDASGGLSIRLAFVAVLLLAHFFAAATASAQSGPDYRGMVERIDARLVQAAEDYRAGRVDGAKAGVQSSYFEIFENLEGPIRINISAKRSFELEAEFGAIRKMMIDKAPAGEVEVRIRRHVAALDQIVPRLEQGHRIVAERSVADEAQVTVPELPKTVEPYWEDAVARIHADLTAAGETWEKGDAEQAKALIRKAQFEGYKNSLLETAIRQHVSQKQDIAFNAEFGRIAGLVDGGRPARLIYGSARVMRDEMTALLPGLPLVGAAKQAGADTSPSADWNAVAATLRAEVARAVDSAAGGDADSAVGLLQNSYFDVFEASGMEARIGARDAAFKTRIEGHFSKLMALARASAPRETLEEVAALLNADVEQAVALLGGSADGGMAGLFSYSLLIILREGFEAILIVSAIVAYLVKTGNGDKQRVIANSVVVALLASVVTAVLLKLVFRTSAASQEVLEGATMLLAAVVLFFTSNWLLAKAEAEKWSTFIKGKLDGALSAGSLRALWLVSFLAVYREGAETVLFYQALAIDADAAGAGAIVAGFIVGCFALVAVYWAMRMGALKLPTGPFFWITGTILYVMAMVFVGKGVMELVEGKIISPTLVAWAPEFIPLGIYPYRETLLPQAAFLLAALVSLAIIARRKPPSKPVATA